MNWIILTLISAGLLGCYDVAKKSSVRDNAVPIVLLLNTTTAAAIWCTILLVDAATGSHTQAFVEATTIGIVQHALLACKSLLVGASWTCAFFALKHLPVSIASPIRSTGPIWTIAAAVFYFGESPSPLQCCGAMVIVLSFLALSRVGRREGINFISDRWVWLMILATLLGAASGLYDKFLLQSVGLPAVTMQIWFSIYLVPVTFPLAGVWYFHGRRESPFRWRWAIPCVAVLLLATDLIYFTALSDPAALISVVSPLRRTSVFVAFIYAILILREENWRAKAKCIGAMVLGVFLISLG